MSPYLMESFSTELQDHLASLERLLDRPEAPEPESLLRLARSVRDGASRAGAETIASVAQRLEDAAGSYASGAITWSDELRGLSRQTVSDLQILMRALNRWGPEEEARVRSAIERWDELADGAEVAHISTLFHEDAGPHVVSAPTTGEWADVVPVQSLLFRGEDALRAALALRPRLEALDRGDVDPQLRDLLDELFDLLRLAAPAEAA